MTTYSDFRRGEILAMNADAAAADAAARLRSDFRQGEIRDLNQDAIDAATQIRSDFRHQEIVELNASEARTRQLATWGLIGLFAAIVFDMMFSKPSTSRRSRT